MLVVAVLVVVARSCLSSLIDRTRVVVALLRRWRRRDLVDDNWLHVDCAWRRVVPVPSIAIVIRRGSRAREAARGAAGAAEAAREVVWKAADVWAWEAHCIAVIVAWLVGWLASFGMAKERGAFSRRSSVVTGTSTSIFLESTALRRVLTWLVYAESLVT